MHVSCKIFCLSIFILYYFSFVFSYFIKEIVQFFWHKKAIITFWPRFSQNNISKGEMYCIFQLKWNISVWAEWEDYHILYLYFYCLMKMIQLCFFIFFGFIKDLDIILDHQLQHHDNKIHTSYSRIFFQAPPPWILTQYC